MPKRPGLSITELQRQIFDREGFRVSFARLGASREELVPYDYPVMAPQFLERLALEADAFRPIPARFQAT